MSESSGKIRITFSNSGSEHVLTGTHVVIEDDNIMLDGVRVAHKWPVKKGPWLEYSTPHYRVWDKIEIRTATSREVHRDAVGKLTPKQENGV